MDYSSTKTTEKESKIELLQSDNRGSLCSGSVVSSSAYIRSELPTVCGQSNCRGEVHEERQQSQQASYRRCQVSSRSSSSIKAIHIWKTKRVPRPAKRVGSVRCLVIAVVAISGKFSRKVCLGLDIELRARKVLHKVLKVKPVD